YQEIIMKPIAALLLLVTIAIVGQAAPPAPRKTRSPAEQEIIALENKWGHTIETGDASTLDRLLAPEFSLSAPDGTMTDRAGTLSDMKSGVIKFDSIVLNDLQVVVFGETALAFGLETEK